MANFSETFALTSRKCVFEPGIGIQNLSEKLNFFSRSPSFFAVEDTKSNLKQFKLYELLWLHSSIFALEC